METYSRRQLRRLLGQNHLRDTYVGATTQSMGPAAYNMQFIDLYSADLSLSGQNAYQGSWLRVEYGGLGYDLRVATFNAGSGCYVSQQYGNVVGTLPAGVPFERHDVLSPTDKDRAIDEAVKAVRLRQEVIVAGEASLGAYPVPTGVDRVLDGFVFATPDATLNRGQTRLERLDVVGTETGPEVRVLPALGASQQLALDALVTVSLGAAEDATVNLPDERLVLYRAEAHCWNLLVRRAPRGTADEYRRLRDEASRQYDLIAKNFRYPVDRPVRLGEVW